MKPSSLTAYFREHLSARIFLIFSVLIIIITLSFTFFFFRYQSRSLTEKTESKGELLASLLAHSASLGVLAENADLLSTPVQGIMVNREVLSVAVYNADGKVLVVENRVAPPSSPDAEKLDAGIEKELKGPTPAVHFTSNGNFVFWTRMALRSRAAQEDAVYFNDQLPKDREQVIGFVRVVLDGKLLQKSLHALLLDSIMIGVVFLVIGSVIAYLIAARVTKPLNRLTEGVNALGRGGECREIAVETGDEIGNLAAAFNNMVESLRKRDEEKAGLEEQLRHSQKMEAIGTLAGGVAHDFNNMLTAINGYGTLIKLELTEGDKLWSFADQIVKAGERGAALTQRLLAFSRKQIISPMPINVNVNVKSLEKILVRLITEDIELKLMLEAADPVVMADSGQLDQVLINLVTNARDAMPQGGTLTITTGIVTRKDDFAKVQGQEEGRNFVAVAVSDTGIGITEEIRKRIFDPFFTTKEVGRGTGLGLSMAYGIIRQHDGMIEVDSEPGMGTSFTIYLPLIEHAAEEQSIQPPMMLRGNHETILVAEDDTAVMGMLKEMLEMSGYNVIEATNGEDAVEKFSANKERIGLALLDVIMPRKNGRQVYEDITRIKPGVKALFMSGYTYDVIDWKDALQEGIHLIPKPVQPNELLLKIKETLEG